MGECISDLQPDGGAKTLGIKVGQTVLYRPASGRQNSTLKTIQHITRIKGVVHVFPMPEHAHGSIQAGGKVIPVIDLGPKVPLKAEKNPEQTHIMLMLDAADIEAMRRSVGEEETAPPLPTMGVEEDSAVEGDRLARSSEKVVAVLHVENASPAASGQAMTEENRQGPARTRASASAIEALTAVPDEV